MFKRLVSLLLGLVALGAAVKIDAGKVDTADLEEPVRWLTQKCGRRIPINTRETAVGFLGVFGVVLCCLGLRKRSSGLEGTKAARDVLATVLLWWTQRDPLTVRDFLNGGVVIFGRSGSGKTSSSGKALARALLKLHRSSGLILSATPSDRAMWEALGRQAGRHADLRVFGPSESFRLNAFDYIMQTAGHPRELTRFLTVVGETLRSTDQSNGEDGQFFEREQARMIYNAVTIVMLALGQIAAPDLQKFIATAAQNPVQREDEQWRKGFHAKTIRQAEQKPMDLIQQQDFKLAVEYFLGELPLLNDRTRSSITTGVFGILHVMCTGIVHELLSTTSNVTPDDLFKGAWILVDMSPSEWGDMGLFVAGAWKYLVQKAILRRQVDAHSNEVTVWADESHQFITSFDNPYAAMCRARQGTLVYLAQSVNSFYGKLKGETGKSQVNALLSNWNTKIFRACGDAQTSDLAVKLLGKQLTTLVGGSTAPQTDLYDEMMGRGKFSGSFSEQLCEVLQSNVFMNGLRTGGPENGYQCDCIVIRSGMPFADGNNFVPCTFDQR